MSKTLDIVMSLKDQVSPKLSKMNSNLQTTSGKLNALGKSITKVSGLLKTAFVGGAIAKLAYDTLKAADIQAKAEKSVQRALVNTGKTAAQAGQELNEYKKFASQQQDITAFGDEGTLQVISGLISQGFGKKSIEDIVAMSQDIARSTGDEQENVTKSLSAYIQTGKGATKLAKAYKLNADLLGKGTTESERLAEVWKAFSESGHKGASTEFLKGFEGQLVAVQGRLDDLKEPVGDLINTLLGGNKDGLTGAAGGLASIGDTIKNATDDLASINEKANELGGGITGLGVAAAYAHPILTTLFVGTVGAKAVTATASLISALGTINTTLGAFASAATTTIGIVAGMTLAATACATAFAWLIEKIGGYREQSAEARAQLDADQANAVGVYSTANGEIYKGGHSIFDNPKANGTNYFEGGRALVGEYGPELVDLPRGSSVKTNAQTQRELSGSNGNVTVNVNIAGNVIGNESFIDQVGQAISSRVSLALSNM